MKNLALIFLLIVINTNQFYSQNQQEYKIDVLLAIDVTSDMGSELGYIKTNMFNIIASIKSSVPNSYFGLVTFRDYPGTYNTCVYNSTYGDLSDSPYQLQSALTESDFVIQSIINQLQPSGGGDFPESYTRVFYESWNDNNIGWREGSKRVVLLWGKGIPHDCNPGLDCVIYSSTGDDLGTPVDLAAALQGMSENEISLIALYSGPSENLPLWECYASKSGVGGATFQGYVVNTEVTNLILGGITNHPPVANAGNDQLIECESCENISVTLDGSNSYDPDGATLTYNWYEGTNRISTEQIVNLALSPGTYTYKLVVYDGQLSSFPDEVEITIQQVISDGKKLDVLLAIDVTSDMGAELGYIKSDFFNIIAGIKSSVPNTYFGLVTFKDYPGTYNTCDYNNTYGDFSDFPYQLRSSLTESDVIIQSRINELQTSGGGDFPESYTRVLYESWNDNNIGWREGSRRVVLLWGKGIPHDCNPGLDCAIYSSTGDDPGTPVDLAAVLQGMLENEISLVALYSGPSEHLPLWECYASKSGVGGAAFQGYYVNAEVIDNITQLQFTEQTSISLPQINYSSTAWGDYDNDGDLDILITGSTSSASLSKVYVNGGNNTFTEQASIILPGVYRSSVDWGDYDNDGDLDILSTGLSSSSAISKVYRNEGNNTFTDQTSIVLPGVYDGSVDWGDYDNDGDLDILLTGFRGAKNEIALSKVYSNNGDNSFTEQTSVQLPGVYYGSVAWADYDNDGYLDILLTGNISFLYQIYISKIYHNNGDKTFSEQSSILLPGVYGSSVAWGDYDNDGDLDFLLTGMKTDYVEISKVYRNNGDNTFTEQTNIQLPGVYLSSVGWGDFDNDGLLDIMLTGNCYNGGASSTISKIYHNNGDNTFSDQTSDLLTGVYDGSAIYGDYDNDGDLDILLTGNTLPFSYVAKIYRNNAVTLNTIPNEPSNLNSTISQQDVTLSWDRSTDNETPQNGLSYNIVIGSIPDGIDILSPMADISNGYRRVVSTGNTGHNNSCTIKGLPEGEYYWSVQAIDNTYAGSTFSTWQSFVTGEVTPEEMVQDILDEIEELINTASFTEQQAQPLITKLEGVLDKIGNNQITAAINQLNAFINQVNAYINSSILTQEEGQMLITSAQELIAELTQLPKYSQELSSDNSSLPEEYKLEQNYPNPFNPATNIKFQIVNPGLVTLKTYDILGNEVATIVNEVLEAGYYSYHWDASRLSSGIYFYQLKAGKFINIKKMILLR